MTVGGGCLCGQSRYAIEGEPLWAGSCYCEDCQRESGSGHLSALAVPADAISVEGPVKIYTAPGGSGQTIDRTFCKECGSTLFSHPHVMGDMRIVRAGSLDDSSAVMPGMAVFCDQAQPWDQPPEGLPAFEGMPAAE